MADDAKQATRGTVRRRFVKAIESHGLKPSPETILSAEEEAARVVEQIAHNAAQRVLEENERRRRSGIDYELTYVKPRHLMGFSGPPALPGSPLASGREEVKDGNDAPEVG